MSVNDVEEDVNGEINIALTVFLDVPIFVSRIGPREVLANFWIIIINENEECYAIVYTNICINEFNGNLSEI